MSSTLTEKAVVGRRVEYLVHRSDTDVYTPGIITSINTTDNGAKLIRVRLDGQRSNMLMPADMDGLRYLDQVEPVPGLPMGRFHPNPDDLEGQWEGVPIYSFGEDGQLIALTGELEDAVAAMNAYQRDMSGCLYSPEDDTVTDDDLVAHWAYFEWQPEDAECPWLVHWTHEGDDQAIQLYYLPA